MCDYKILINIWIDPSNQEYGPPVTVSNAAEFVLLESIYRIPGTTPEYVYRIVEYGSVYKVSCIW